MQRMGCGVSSADGSMVTSSDSDAGSTDFTAALPITEAVLALPADVNESKATGSFFSTIVTQRGYIEDRTDKPNQDRAIAIHSLPGAPELGLFGAFDGHGENGHLVAEYVVQTLPGILALQRAAFSDDASQDQMLQGFRTAVDVLNRRIVEEMPLVNIVFSGSTAVFAVGQYGCGTDTHQRKKLLVANMGDSRAILCRQKARVPGNKATAFFQALPLSFDHKPDRACESERILAAGGRIDTMDGPLDEYNGPARVWLQQHDIPGLALSRVISGDLCARSIGVSTEPELVVHDILANDAFALFASDGVWEFLENQDVADIVWQHRHDVHAAAEAVVQEATLRWKQNETVIDDITCVLVQLVASVARGDSN